MIAYGMLYTVAVGLPIGLAALAISAVLRRHGKPERLAWVAGLVTALLLPLIALLDPFGGSGMAPVPQTGVIGLPEILVVPDQSPTLGLGQLLLGAWLLASGLLAIRWAVATLRLARASRSWTPDTLDGVSVWLTERLGPAVAGTFRPRVLVPAWLRTLPPTQRALVLLHEQEHVRAHDPKLIALARLARVLTPWNPAVWFLCARLVRAVELDCDRRVLRQNADVAAYGHTLLKVSEQGPGRLAAVAAFAESEAPLRSRILAMTTPPRTVSVVALLTSMVLGVVLLVGALQIPVPTVSVQISMEGRVPAPVPGSVSPSVVAPSPSTVEQAADEDLGARLRQEATAGRAEALDRLRAGPRAGVEAAPTSADEVTAALSGRVRPDVVRRVEESGRSYDVAAGLVPEASAGPVFTPYTVAPVILNREEVVQAMVREYPSLLRDAGIGGRVTVFFYIDEDGTVQDTRIDRSSGHRPLDEAALAVASVYRFSPALNRGRRTPVWVSFPITFQPR